MYDPNYKVKDFYSYLERAKTLYGDKALFRFNKKTEVVDVSYEEFFNLVTKMALAFKELDIAGKTIAEYLATTNYDMKRIAVERNGDIVPKAQYGETVLQDGDSLEVVSFVGGG